MYDFLVMLFLLIGMCYSSWSKLKKMFLPILLFFTFCFFSSSSDILSENQKSNSFLEQNSKVVFVQNNTTQDFASDLDPETFSLNELLEMDSSENDETFEIALLPDLLPKGELLGGSWFHGSFIPNERQRQWFIKWGPNPDFNPVWLDPDGNPAFHPNDPQKLIMLRQARRYSETAEKKHNESLKARFLSLFRKKDSNYCGIGVKNGLKFYHPYKQLRDKFHHQEVFQAPVPKALKSEMPKLRQNNNHKKRLFIFRDTKKLPSHYIEVLAIQLQTHVINPETDIIRGTLGKNAEARVAERRRAGFKEPARPHQKGFLLYNKKTNIVAFYDQNRVLVTYLQPSTKQIDDIELNGNLL